MIKANVNQYHTIPLHKIEKRACTLLRCVVWQKLTNISEVLTASIIRVMTEAEPAYETLWGYLNIDKGKCPKIYISLMTHLRQKTFRLILHRFVT
jgi:hypothetical protein